VSSKEAPYVILLDIPNLTIKYNKRIGQKEKEKEKEKEKDAVP
jgi:hypothetical protein